MHSIPPLGDEEGIHYHIRWADSHLDWQAFASPAEANASAEKLARTGEAFTVERFDGNCSRCAELPRTAHEKAKEKEKEKEKTELQGGGTLFPRP